MSVAKYWRKQKEHYSLVGRKCDSCSKLIFPPRDVCNSCGGTSLTDHSFDGRGEIVSFTIIRTSVSDSEGENIEIPARNIPYALGIIRLAEGPCLTAQIVDCHADELRIGSKVEVVFRKINEKGEKGIIQYGYKFRIVD